MKQKLDKLIVTRLLLPYDPMYLFFCFAQNKMHLWSIRITSAMVEISIEFCSNERCRWHTDGRYRSLGKTTQEQAKMDVCILGGTSEGEVCVGQPKRWFFGCDESWHFFPSKPQKLAPLPPLPPDMLSKWHKGKGAFASACWGAWSRSVNKPKSKWAKLI